MPNPLPGGHFPLKSQDFTAEFRLAMIRSPVKPTVHLRRLLELMRLYGKAFGIGYANAASK